MGYEAASDPLSATFFALADPTRRAILARLASGSATVKELAAPFEMSGPAVSKHLRVLERAGLVQQGRDAQFRPRTLNAAPLREATDWTGEFRRFWEASFARLDGYLDELKQKEGESHVHDGVRPGRKHGLQPAQRHRDRRRPRVRRAPARRL